MKQDIHNKVFIGPHEVNEFWQWFVKHEKRFFKAVHDSDGKDIFFKLLTPRLSKLYPEIFYLVGFFDNKAQLIFTPDGRFKNIVFAEELVAMAPELSNWMFTALKPPALMDIATLEFGDFVFTKDNLHFYANEHDAFPDEIDLTIVYDDYKASADELITNGIYIYLDNYLGELQSITLIDNVTVIGRDSVDQELIPIMSLQDFLRWREKEFIEQYESDYVVNSENHFSFYKGEIINGLPLVAYMNTQLLEWEDKPSRPYIIIVSLGYPTTHEEGMPDEESVLALTRIEESLADILQDKSQYLYIGQQTGDGVREIYFVSKEFRICSKRVHEMLSTSSEKLNGSYEIYKDKYWQTFERYRKHQNL